MSYQFLLNLYQSKIILICWKLQWKLFNWKYRTVTAVSKLYDIISLSNLYDLLFSTNVIGSYLSNC